MPDTERVWKHSSRMKGNFQVRFLGEKGGVILPTYPTCPFNFHNFFCYRFLWKLLAYSTMCFWNLLHFSILCLHWKLLTSISGSFSWDNNWKLLSEHPIAGTIPIACKIHIEIHISGKLSVCPGCCSPLFVFCRLWMKERDHDHYSVCPQKL